MNPATLIRKFAVACAGAAVGATENKIISRRTGSYPNARQALVAAAFGAGSLFLFAAIERQLGLTDD